MRNAFFIVIAVGIFAGCWLAEDAVAGAIPLISSQPAALALRLGKFILTGHVVDAGGKVVPSARVQAGTRMARTDAQGSFRLPVTSGESKISISASGYAPFALPVSISADTDLKVELELSAVTTVSVQSDDPASSASTRIYPSEELLQAQPGQPGVPISLPGYPSETASGG